VGDKVEFEALCRLRGRPERPERRCALGSVKSNIGHTKAAAGAAGLVKAVLALHHKVLPPTLKADEPDPALDIDASPFYLNTRARPWLSAPGRPRRAGVSAFGFGGSNFHVVLEEHRPEKPAVSWDGSVEILAFSAADPAGIREAVRRLRREAGSAAPDRMLAFAAARSRAEFSPQHAQRLLVVIEGPEAFAAALESALAALDSHQTDGLLRTENLYLAGRIERGRLAFLFPGQGSQYPGMGRDLVCTFPQAMAMIAKADGCMGPGPSLNEMLYPAVPGPRREMESALRATEIAQPAIGAVSLAMAAALEYFGVVPDGVGGHSFGELTALCAAGWMSPEAFLDLAAARGMAMALAGSAPGSIPGGMLAVRAPLARIEELIRRSGTGVVLANRNSPDQGVLSGPQAAIAAAAEHCRRQGFAVFELPVSGAFHSPLMQSALQPFLDRVAGATLTPTSMPVFSNSLAGRYPQDAGSARQILGRHLLQPVDFVGEIEAMYAAGFRTFVEVGPRSVLTGLAGAILAPRPFQAQALDPSAGARSGTADLARTLCLLAALGYPVQLTKWEDPAPPLEIPRMQVLVGGANLGPSQPKPGRQAPARPSGPAPGDQRPATAAPAEKPSSRVSDVGPAPAQPSEKDTMKKDPHAPLVNALQSVQEGLKAIQAIQLQTAQVHQKFLETQSEAGRILLELVKSTGLTAASALRLPEPAAVEPRHPEAAPLPIPAEPRAAAPTPVAYAAAPPPGAAALVDSIPDPGDPRKVSAIAPEALSGSASARSAIAAALLAVVSELTGYPAEMLGMDMDIESDLGIDSIKRVEILSAMEERMPGLPPVAPEDMARLKTLDQIVTHLSGPASGPGRPPAAPPESTGDAVEPPSDRRLVLERLLAVVSELTGYPAEMLGMDMDIESDLGIDSIKRVEILSAMEERMPGLAAVAPEDMGRLKTLDQIATHLAGPAAGALPPPVDPAAAVRAVNAAAVHADPQPDICAPRRQVAVAETAPPPEVRIGIPKGRKVFVTDDRSGLSQAIADELGALGVNTVLISVDILKYKKDLPHAGGLIIVQNPGSADVDADLRYAFELTRVLARDLLESARLEGAFFATVTRLDGAFGFNRRTVANPEQGALAGLAKTAALEWPDVRCHALDLAPGWTDPRAAAQAVLRELMTRGPVEVGLDRDRRLTLVLETAAYPRGRVNLAEGDVLVVSGGGRGVTAACALELARRVRPTLILLGRASDPFPEPAWLAPLEDESEVRKALLAHEFAGAAGRPAEVERRLRQLLANREISRTLERLKAAGAAAHYRCVDVREAARVREVLADVRDRFGPIRGLLHGAGVVEDRLIVDKTIEQFERVFDTKVKGFKALLAATRPDELKTLVVFSSITARLGNKGQADYAMANEALNKMAQAESMRRPACRTVAVNWGPWNGGMVGPALKREFERQGIPLLDRAEGAAALVREMGRDAAAPVEIVIGGSLDADSVCMLARPEKPELALLFEREIDVESCPVLSSHVIDGRAVVPLALMTEWFGHGALHENPGLVLHGLEELRVLNGIRLTEPKDPAPARVLRSRTRAAQRAARRQGCDPFKGPGDPHRGIQPASRLCDSGRPERGGLPAQRRGGLRSHSFPRPRTPWAAANPLLHGGRHGGRNLGRPGPRAVAQGAAAQQLAVRSARARLGLSNGQPVVL
jgi:malonyl CoA-acyl carrier protein transacylase/NADP-dependent 3-hydroxy acid dehydrogenase YdfG